jgi:hypothetical protein
MSNVNDIHGMIERCAKAVGDSLYGYVDKNDTPYTWSVSVNLVITVFKEAREPSDAIKNVVTGSIYYSAEEIWQAMVDAVNK